MTDEPNSTPPKWLMSLTLYQGELSLDGSVISVTFRVAINAGGEVVLEIDPIPVDDRSEFIVLQWNRDPARFVHFGLTGIAEDGTRFETSDLFFTSIGAGLFGISSLPIEPKGQCSTATITWKLKHSIERPLLRIRVKAFRAVNGHDLICPLGHVAMMGQHTIEDADSITGSFDIQASNSPSDPAQWRERADRLLDHIRRTMSFASSTILRDPIQEFYIDDTATITYRFRSRASLSGHPLMHFHDLEAIFETAVHSFFAPPIPSSDLRFAIEWLSMDASYNEVRLLTAMTALENLLNANLAKTDAFIVPGGKFKRIRSALKDVIRTSLSDAPTGDAIASEMSTNLGQINRRSFLLKLRQLATHWHVPLDGISDEMLEAAKNARDRIVHRGKYYEDAENEPLELWRHVDVIREVAARFVMVAIGYKGRYQTYRDGPRDAVFPPAPD